MAGGGGIVVRPATPADLGAVARLEAACFDDPWPVAALAEELTGDLLRAPLVAELDGEVVGYLMAWSVVDQLHILNLATDVRRRRLGIGAALLREAARAALARGLVSATLEVRRSNDEAQAFYRRFGFAETGLRPGYYSDNGEDAILMDAPLASVVGA